MVHYPAAGRGWTRIGEVPQGRLTVVQQAVDRAARRFRRPDPVRLRLATSGSFVRGRT